MNKRGFTSHYTSEVVDPNPMAGTDPGLFLSFCPDF